MALFSMIAVYYTFEKSLKEELRLRGIFIVRSLGARVQEPLLLNDLLRLHELVEEENKLASDIAYILILDNKQMPLVYTFKKGVPVELPQINVLKTGQEYNIEQLYTGESNRKYIYDVAAPILLDNEFLGTVRVGLKLAPTMDRISQTLRLLVFMALLVVAVSLFISKIVSRRISLPLSNLAAAAEDFAGGKLESIPKTGRKLNCWEVMKCSKEDCPAHSEPLIPCWYTVGALRRGKVQGIYARKLGDCKKCKYYKRYFGDEVDRLGGAFLYMACSLVRGDEEVKRHIKELTLINNLIKDISSKLDLKELLSSVVKIATQASGADAGAIAIYDEQRQIITYPYFYNMPDNLIKVIVPKGGGLAGYTMQERRPIILEDYPAHPKAVPEFVAGGLKTLLAVPLISGEKALGALGVFGLTPGKRFSHENIPVVQAIGDEAAIAIDKARLYEALKKAAAEMEVRVEGRTRQISALCEISRMLSGELELPHLLDSLLKEASSLVGAGSGAMGIIDYKAGIAKGRAYNSATRIFQDVSANIDQGVPSEIIRTKKPLRVADTSKEFTLYDTVIQEYNIKSFLVIPVIRDDQVVAIIGLHDKLDGKPFDEEDEALLTSISDQAALAIEKGRLYGNLKLQAQQLLEVNQKLAKLNRLKSEFLANMSHELRTPLNSIIGFTGIILQGMTGKINAEQKKQLEMVFRSAKHLLELINDILDMSKIEAGKMEVLPQKFDLREVVTESISTVYPMIEEKRLELIVRMPEVGCQLYSDRAKVRQILINLLGNAVKFTNQGRIEVKGHLRAGGRELVLSVSDTGIGIKKEDLEGIFDVFKQLHRPYEKKPEGTGLGLSISQKMVHMLGGSIWVKSQYGRGSKFSFSLPVLVLPETDRKAMIQEKEKPSKSGLLALTIEDQSDAREMLKTFLESEGYQVSQAHTGEEAIQMARVHNPFAIILDILMPDQNGWEILRRLNALPETKNFPVVIIAILDNINFGLSLGAAACLAKPIEKEVLINTLKYIEKGIIIKINKVLIIDDNTTDVKLLADMLESQKGEDYKIIKSSGGKEGLALVDREQPDLIILDLLMPEVNGFEVIKALKLNEHTKNIPIIIITAKDPAQGERDSLNQNIQRIMLKGHFTKDELLSDIKATLKLLRSRGK